jgi:hypothetical protein
VPRNDRDRGNDNFLTVKVRHMDMVTFVSSTHTFDYNGKEYDVLIKADRSVRLIDVFSNRILLVTDVDSVYGSEAPPPGLDEALFMVQAIEKILK